MFSVPTRRRLFTAASATLLLAGCSNASTSDDGPDPASDETETTTLKITAVQSPMTYVSEAAAHAIEGGCEIELGTVSHYITTHAIGNDGAATGTLSPHEPYK